jgi:hypothetical protein
LSAFWGNEAKSSMESPPLTFPNAESIANLGWRAKALRLAARTRCNKLIFLIRYGADRQPHP